MLDRNGSSMLRFMYGFNLKSENYGAWRIIGTGASQFVDSEGQIVMVSSC